MITITPEPLLGYTLGAEGAELDMIAAQLIAADASMSDIEEAMRTLTSGEVERLATKLLALGADPWRVNTAKNSVLRGKRVKSTAAIWGILGTASMAASAYHGYKRNQSIGWALVWGFFGAVAPVITPVIGIAQGFGKRK